MDWEKNSCRMTTHKEMKTKVTTSNLRTQQKGLMQDVLRHFDLCRSECISLVVGINDRLLAFFAFHRVAVFHSNDAVEAFTMNMLEDIEVIDFPCSWFFPSRIITCLEVCDFIPAGVDIGDEVPLADLLVINVEEDFA